jgi:PAS domain S-box-containing protein
MVYERPAYLAIFTHMNQFSEFFRKLFDTADFPPRWYCGHWTDFHGWFYIISDLLVWSAYFTIPLIIIKYIANKKARFKKVYVLFAIFILACGATHFLDAMMFWIPAYRLSALVRFITGIASWLTIYYLFRVLPEAFSLKSAEQLEEEVAQRKIAEEQLRINNQILIMAQDIAKMGSWQWDVSTDRVIWSEGMKQIYGLQELPERITYTDFLKMVHPDDREHIAENVKRAFDEKKFPEFYHRVLWKDGTVKTVHANGTVMLDDKGDVQKIIGTSQDVTIQKQFEQQLLNQSKQLESTNEELQKFASVASHDLREPLRKIITFSSMLQKESSEALGEKGKFYLDKIITGTTRMQVLIDNILDFSRLSDRGYTFQKTDLNYIIQEVIADMEVAITDTNTKITIDNLPQIEVNAGQMGRLFQNLIANAIKFRKKDVPPEINIAGSIIKGSSLPKEYFGNTRHEYSVISNAAYWENENFCRISVKDNGIGFDERFLDKIFLIFQRLHSKSEFEGTGIGLAVCKKVVDIHHGIITAQSKPGEGAEFIIILPVSQKNFSM